MTSSARAYRQIKGINKIEEIVGRSYLVLHIDQQHFTDTLDLNIHAHYLNARLPSKKRVEYLCLDLANCCTVIQRKEQILNAATKLRAHQSFSRRGRKDRPDGFADILLVLRRAYSTVPDQLRKTPPAAEEITVGHRFPFLAVLAFTAVTRGTSLVDPD